MRRGQRTFRPDNKEDRYTCFFTCRTVSSAMFTDSLSGSGRAVSALSVCVCVFVCLYVRTLVFELDVLGMLVHLYTI